MNFIEPWFYVGLLAYVVGVTAFCWGHIRRILWERKSETITTFVILIIWMVICGKNVLTNLSLIAVGTYTGVLAGYALLHQEELQAARERFPFKMAHTTRNKRDKEEV